MSCRNTIPTPLFSLRRLVDRFDQNRLLTVHLRQPSVSPISNFFQWGADHHRRLGTLPKILSRPSATHAFSTSVVLGLFFSIGVPPYLSYKSAACCSSQQVSPWQPSVCRFQLCLLILASAFVLTSCCLWIFITCQVLVQSLLNSYGLFVLSFSTSSLEAYLWYKGSIATNFLHCQRPLHAASLHTATWVEIIKTTPVRDDYWVSHHVIQITLFVRFISITNSYRPSDIQISRVPTPDSLCLLHALMSSFYLALLLKLFAK